MALARIQTARILFANLTNISFESTKKIMNISKFVPASIRMIVHIRKSSYRSSQPVGDPSQYTDYEIDRNPPEWKYVEQLLSNKVIPEPIPKQNYPSGWKPQDESCVNNPYYVARTKNHMLPINVNRTFRGQRKITTVRKVQGDIWLLEQELTAFLSEKMGRKIASQVHEVCGNINYKGDFVTLVEEYLLNKGF